MAMMLLLLWSGLLQLILLYGSLGSSLESSSALAHSLRIRDFHVPSTVLEGKRILLKCGFDHHRASRDVNLISLVWHKDDVPFFIFKPDPPKPNAYGTFLSSSYLTDGTSYYYDKGSDEVDVVTVTLPTASSQIQGSYKCQIRFHILMDPKTLINSTLPETYELSDSREKDLSIISRGMLLYSYPKSAPKITKVGGIDKETDYIFGDSVVLNCVSDLDYPAPRIDWQFVGTGGKLFAIKWDELIPYPNEVLSTGFERSKLGLSTTLQGHREFICITTYFPEGVLKAGPITTKTSYKIQYEGITFEDPEPIEDASKESSDNSVLIIVIASLSGVILLTLAIIICLSVGCYKKNGCQL